MAHRGESSGQGEWAVPGSGLVSVLVSALSQLSVTIQLSRCSHLQSTAALTMSHQEHENLEPYMEDCSDTDDEYSAYQYHNNNNIPSNNNNNNTEFEDKNNNNNNSSSRSGTTGAGQHSRTQPPSHQPHQGSVPGFHHKLHDRPLNITVTAKVLFGSVSAISALNAERKKKPS